MKKKLGVGMLITSPFIFITYIFINDFIYKFPSFIFNIILLYVALSLYLISLEKKD